MTETDFTGQAEQLHYTYYEDMTIGELQIRLKAFEQKTHILTNGWGQELYQAPTVCAICGVHCDYSLGHKPQVWVVHHGFQKRLNSTYCPDCNENVKERDHIRAVLKLREHNTKHNIPIEKEHIISHYRQRLALDNDDLNRCIKCTHGKACMECGSSVNGHSNVFKRSG